MKDKEQELVSVNRACQQIEANTATARAALYAAGLVVQTPFGPRVLRTALDAWFRSFPPIDRNGVILPRGDQGAGDGA
jgi:hypothetical protein